MTHTYSIGGMTCMGCKTKIEGLLSAVAGVKRVEIDFPNKTADIEMDRHISTSVFTGVLQDYPKYQISGVATVNPPAPFTEEKETKSWFATYKPIILIFGYITTISVNAAVTNGYFSILEWMRVFMAGFFMTFSFFKMLDLKAFAESYSMYDIIAKRIPVWGYIYAFLELGLGLSYATNFKSSIINYITLLVMSVSIIGVLQSVFNKRKIKCACLGAVFNLPMSTVTIIEDALMIAMSIAMIILMR
jgi:copper chaperone CopZ